jgi:hypothetical protein
MPSELLRGYELKGFGLLSPACKASRLMKLVEKVKNPTCPNCGQPMTFVREGQSSALCADPHVFECTRCLVVLMTEDHETLSGFAIH